jgi:hypothetical protein
MPRPLAFLVNRLSGLSEARIPDSRLDPVMHSSRRRLIDAIEEVMKRACAGNELEEAADLLTLLEKWHARRATQYGRDRRLHRADLQRVRRELDRVLALRRSRGTATATTPRL